MHLLDRNKEQEEDGHTNNLCLMVMKWEQEEERQQ